jgi:formylglycine-generating enzyme required for sulfatase activity
VWKEPMSGMEFVWVPGGCFMMGQAEAEKQYLIKERGQETYDKFHKRELPRHEVCVDGFWMGKYEVTNRQYRKYKISHDSKSSKGITLNGDDQPVVYVPGRMPKGLSGGLSKIPAKPLPFLKLNTYCNFCLIHDGSVLQSTTAYILISFSSMR